MTVRRETLSLLALDLFLVMIAWLGAFWLRFNLDIPPEFLALAWLSCPWAMLAFATGLVIAQVYRQVWRYVGLPELRQLGIGILLGAVLSAAAVLMLRYPHFPRSVLLLQPLLALVFLGAVRASWRTLVERKALVVGSRPVLIVGSLQDATDALRALKGSRQWHPLGILSPVAGELGRSLQNVPVLGGINEVAAIARSTGTYTALVACPPGSPERRDVLLQPADAGLTLLTMPRPDDHSTGKHRDL